MVHWKKHFAFSSLGEHLTGKKKPMLAILISALMLVFSVAMFFHGLEAVRTFWNHNRARAHRYEEGFV